MSDQTFQFNGFIKASIIVSEGEDIKKDVFSQLGRMEGQTNVISTSLLHLYTPVEVVEEVVDLEEDGEDVAGEPQTSLALNKINHRWPA